MKVEIQIKVGYLFGNIQTGEILIGYLLVDDIKY